MTNEKFEQLVPNEEIRNYILSELDEDWCDSVENYPIVYNNIVNLAFMYCFSCYHELNNCIDEKGNNMVDTLIDQGNANATRVLKTMRKIYSEYELTNEIMQFILMDVYFDFSLGRKSNLSKYFPKCFNVNSEVHLGDMFTLINKSLGFSRASGQLVRKEADEKLVQLLELFPFLNNVDLEYDSEREWYVFKLKTSSPVYSEGIINTFHIINKVKVRRARYHFISSIEQGIIKYQKINCQGYVNCNLTGLDGNSTYKDGVLYPQFELPFDNEFLFSFLSHTDLEIKKITNIYFGVIDQLFNIKYKYLKNLSLAIADALGRNEYAECARKLESDYLPKYNKMFNSFDKISNHWDSVVLMLLIEEGPQIILQKLFMMDFAISEDILINLQNRFQGDIAKEIENKIPDNRIREIAENTVRLHHIDYEKVKSVHYLNLHKSLVAETMASIILSIIVKSEEKEDSDVFFIGDVQQNIEVLQNIDNTAAYEEKVHILNVAFADMLKRIICFYDGVFDYAQVKIEYNHKSAEKMLSSSEIIDYQNKAEKAFVNAVKRCYDSLLNINSVKQIVIKFIEMLTKCYTSSADGKTYSKTKFSELLYAVLGKNTIIEFKTTKEQFNNVFNAVEDVNNNNINWWIEKAIEVLSFIKKGPKDNESNFTFNALSPYVASYNRRNDGTFGYNTVMFSLIIETFDENSNASKEINILTEFYYNMNSKYYCLPNIGCSTSKWWIDPFIIKCQLFDDIFEKR